MEHTMQEVCDLSTFEEEKILTHSNIFYKKKRPLLFCRNPALLLQMECVL